GIPATTATLEPAQRVENVMLLQILLGITVATPEQRPQDTGLRLVAQWPPPLTFPAPAQPRMDLCLAGQNPATASLITQQEGPVGMAPFHCTPFGILAPALQLLN